MINIHCVDLWYIWCKTMITWNPLYTIWNVNLQSHLTAPTRCSEVGISLKRILLLMIWKWSWPLSPWQHWRMDNMDTGRTHTHSICSSWTCCRLCTLSCCVYLEKVKLMNYMKWNRNFFTCIFTAICILYFQKDWDSGGSSSIKCLVLPLKIITDLLSKPQKHEILCLDKLKQAQYYTIINVAKPVNLKYKVSHLIAPETAGVGGDEKLTWRQQQQPFQCSSTSKLNFQEDIPQSRIMYHFSLYLCHDLSVLTRR